jgi:hypothetical protein
MPLPEMRERLSITGRKSHSRQWWSPPCATGRLPILAPPPSEASVRGFLPLVTKYVGPKHIVHQGSARTKRMAGAACWKFLVRLPCRMDRKRPSVSTLMCAGTAARGSGGRLGCWFCRPS